MHILKPGAAMDAEVNAQAATDLLKWLPERMDAIKEIRDAGYDTMARNIFAKGLHRVGSIPHCIWEELNNMTKGEFAVSQKMQEAWLMRNPEYATVTFMKRVR